MNIEILHVVIQSRDYGQDFAVGELNFYGAGPSRRGIDNPPAVSEIHSLRVERGNFTVDAKLQTAGIVHAAESGLIGNAVCAHASSDGRIHTDASGDSVVPFLGSGVGVGILAQRRPGCEGRLARLNLDSVRIPQRYVLSRALEIVGYAIDGGDVR